MIYANKGPSSASHGDAGGYDYPYIILHIMTKIKGLWAVSVRNSYFAATWPCPLRHHAHTPQSHSCSRATASSASRDVSGESSSPKSKS